MSAFEIRQRDPRQLVWEQASLSREDPHYRCGTGSYKRSVYVDPHPCYTHDVGLVADVLTLCEAAHPLPGAAGAAIYVLPHEFVGRNNGITYEDAAYTRPDGSNWQDRVKCHCCDEQLNFRGQAHTIVLCGKRIPIMATMTRYLVAHEYGHAVFNHRRRLLGYSPGDAKKLEVEYMRIRGVSDWRESEDARWHQLGSEVVANDFRILIAGQEVEFWPHDVPHPRDAPGRAAVEAWWRAPLAPAAPPPEPA